MAVDIDGVNSTISTDKLIPQSGTALQIGESGDTVTLVGSAVGFGGGSDCVRIATTTLASSASSITMDNSFSATYTYYMIRCMMVADGNIYPRFRLLDSSGAELTASNWSWAGTASYRNASNSVGVGTCTGWGSDFLASGEMMSSDANMKHMWNIDVADPFGSGFDCSVHGFSNLFDGTYWRNSTMEGAYTTHATYRGFKIYVSSGNLLAGTEVSVYGLTNS